MPQAQNHYQGNKAAVEGRSEEGGVQHWARACGLCEALARATQEGFLVEVLLRVKPKLPHHCNACPITGAPGKGLCLCDEMCRVRHGLGHSNYLKVLFHESLSCGMALGQG